MKTETPMSNEQPTERFRLSNPNTIIDLPTIRDNVERIREALQFVDASDRETWLRMGMAIKSELGENGFDMWEAWSRQADSFNARDARDVWKSIRADGEVTIGTLFYQAKENGWLNDGVYRKPTPGELASRRRISEESVAKEEAEIASERAKTAANAAAILKVATEAKSDHPYLSRKRIRPVATLREIDASEAAAILHYPPKSAGEALVGRLLVVPIKRGQDISTLELIDEQGHKTALVGRGTKLGGYWATQRLPDGDGAGLTLLIGEGVATVLSATEASGELGIAALSSGNLRAVAKAMHERYPAAAQVILADLVRATGEPDHHAVKAAKGFGGKLAVPEFGSDRDPAMTDFNDLMIQGGAEAVARAIAHATAPAGGEPVPGKGAAPVCPSGVNGWPDPQPLGLKIDPVPYPLDALPGTLRNAVAEVQGFVKAPIPLVASSALSALSVAVQAHIDVQRADRLAGPVGVYTLTVADSGERKSTVDGFFATAIRNFERQQAEAMAPELAEAEAELAAWNAKREGILGAIRAAKQKGKSTGTLERDLAELQHEKPQAPRVPHLILGDETPEALAHKMRHGWPSAGVLSAEAGVIFGSHAMGRDSVMRNLALLNILWDGGELSIGRKTSESFTLRGARLTAGLQVQEATLAAFFERSGTLARGTGFLARFLLSWPDSTQGFRPFTEAPAHWPHLAAFNRRMEALLNIPPPFQDDGTLAPAVLTMTSEARAAWVGFHDAIEGQLRDGGELREVRDVASKTADNAARLAALFHAFEVGIDRPVSAEAFAGAARVAAWHLNEARRFFGELALPAELADAGRLDAWLLMRCRETKTPVVHKNHARQHGPLRDGSRLNAALRELEELGRLRVVEQGRRRDIEVNPRLLEGTP